MASQPIVVIGAGVLGLSTAVILQERHPLRHISIVAEEFPYPPPSLWGSTEPSADYASMWAGAHYRPIPGDTGQLIREREWSFQTATRMKSIAKSAPEAGIEFMQGLLHLEDPAPEYASLKSGDSFSFKSNDRSFRVMSRSELPPGVTFGCEYASYCVNPHLYCLWLFRNFKNQGGGFAQRKLKIASDAFAIAKETFGMQELPIIVNCSGRNFNSDKLMRIIRGQTVLVRNEYHCTTARVNNDGSWSFLIPRPWGGGTIIGGTKEYDDWHLQARKETRKDLLEQAVKMFPSFARSVDELDVVRDNVGRRPFRQGGVRIEREVVAGNHHIVHGYGAGGRGYELSWGIAEDVADVVDSCLTPCNPIRDMLSSRYTMK